MMRRARLAQYLFTGVGILALGICLAEFLGAKFYEAREARNFDRELRLTPVANLAAPETGGVDGEIEIPRLGVSVMIVEGADNSQLKRAVGHIPGTAFPWEPGNVGIAGHRDTFFRPLRFIQPDDKITLVTLRGTYSYRVKFTDVVEPDDTQVLNPTGEDSLTLVTCFPFYYIGPAPKRFIVRAERTPGLSSTKTSPQAHD